MASKMTEQTSLETPASATPAQSAASTSVDDLNALLTEFESANKPPEPQPTEQAPAAATPDAATPDKVLAAFDRADVEGLRNYLQSYANTVHGLQLQQKINQDHADFENVVSEFNKTAKERGYLISDDYARRWLLAESVTNPQLRAAFDNRYDSPDNERRAVRLIKKAQDRFIASAKSEPDRQARGEREAVAWAVRNSMSAAPPAPPVRYCDLNDAEFTAEKKKYGL
jgi:hypothetical protein